ncbi:hypothetical protein [Pseudohoeflea coraliihabitans]|uniref:Uncharacterized protein n=1 Tax=Pseudohoeflea coraliihabitans TaxID=2860393 RepID=A0ABS6WJG4_9HYPH|nr:hypothetical protein [Pseudohoeflea sp. DP4N28-3]MBW3096083.1 hypothetical protein [Pseudohoeflea sp. DP4N28-3]
MQADDDFGSARGARKAQARILKLAIFALLGCLVMLGVLVNGARAALYEEAHSPAVSTTQATMPARPRALAAIRMEPNSIVSPTVTLQLGQDAADQLTRSGLPVEAGPPGRAERRPDQRLVKGFLAERSNVMVLLLATFAMMLVLTTRIWKRAPAASPLQPAPVALRRSRHPL